MIYDVIAAFLCLDVGPSLINDLTAQSYFYHDPHLLLLCLFAAKYENVIGDARNTFQAIQCLVHFSLKISGLDEVSNGNRNYRYLENGVSNVVNDDDFLSSFTCENLCIASTMLNTLAFANCGNMPSIVGIA